MEEKHHAMLTPIWAVRLRSTDGEEIASNYGALIQLAAVDSTYKNLIKTIPINTRFSILRSFKLKISKIIISLIILHTYNYNLTTIKITVF